MIRSAVTCNAESMTDFSAIPFERLKCESNGHLYSKFKFSAKIKEENGQNFDFFQYFIALFT